MHAYRIGGGVLEHSGAPQVAHIVQQAIYIVHNV